MPFCGTNLAGDTAALILFLSTASIYHVCRSGRASEGINAYSFAFRAFVMSTCFCVVFRRLKVMFA
jgi:hypothetical protein